MEILRLGRLVLQQPSTMSRKSADMKVYKSIHAKYIKETPRLKGALEFFIDADQPAFFGAFRSGTGSTVAQRSKASYPGFVTTLVYLDILVAAVATDVVPQSIEISDGIFSLTKFISAKPDQMRNLFSKIEAHLTERLTQEPTDHYLAELQKSQLIDFEQILDIRDALVVQMLLREQPPATFIFLAAPPMLARTHGDTKDHKGRLTITDRETVRCYRILLATRPKKAAQFLLPVLAVSEDVILFDDRNVSREAIHTIRGKLEFLWDVIELVLSIGIVFDPHELTLHSDDRITFGKMRLLRGREQLQMYCRVHSSIEELHTLRLFISQWLSFPDYSSRAMAYLTKVRDSSEEEFFYFEPFGEETIYYDKLRIRTISEADRMSYLPPTRNVANDNDPLYEEITIPRSNPFDFAKTLPFVRATRVIVYGVDKEETKWNVPPLHNNWTKNLSIERQNPSKKLTEGMDLRGFSALEKIEYTEETKFYPPETKFYPPICPPSLKELKITGDFMISALPEAVSACKDLTLTLSKFKCQNIPEAGLTLDNVTTLCLYQCSSAKEYLNRLDLPNLSRIDSPDGAVPKTIPKTLIVNLFSAPQLFGQHQFTTIEIHTSYVAPSTWGRVRMTNVIIYSPVLDLSRRKFDDAVFEKVQEVVLKVAPHVLADEEPDSKRKIRWRFEYDVKLDDIKKLCTKAELASAGSVYAKKLLVTASKLKDIPQQLTFDEVLVDFRTNDEATLKGLDFVTRKLKGIECLPGPKKLSNATIKMLRNMFGGAPVTIGPVLG